MLLFFDASARDFMEVEAVEKEKQAAGDKRQIRCRSCRGPVTDESERVTVGGKHVYLRTNPAGIEYEFGCFGHAEGCAALGEATGEYTWFPGYRWQVGICSHCGSHLGWVFSAESRFFGLILARLQEDT